MNRGFSLQRTLSVARKEFLHVLRDPATLFFACFIPILELCLLGYAIDTNVRYIRTVVLDMAKTQESEQLIRRFENSTTFQILPLRVHNDQELSEAIIAGEARVGIKIPANYSRRTTYGMEPAQVLVLIDGSEATTASTASSVAQAIVLEEALKLAAAKADPTATSGTARARDITSQPRVEAETRILFNPNTRSANFFIPGLIVVMTQLMSTMLSVNAIVREKENGTLEQLFMTPVRPVEMIAGKMAPYLILTFAEFCAILFMMWSIFRVPVHGPVFTLLALALPFVLCFLGIGLLISIRVETRDAASHAAMGTLLPSIFLSGYVFPLDSMPKFFYWLAQLFPTTWLIDAARGVILRGASWNELWLHAVVLWSMGLGAFVMSMMMFRKRL